MKRVLTVEEMSGADANATAMGIPSLVLMERAALSVVEEIFARKIDVSSVLVVCGPGNNGGDGAAIARLFAEKGIISDLLLTGEPKKRSPQLAAQLEILKHYDINFVEDISDGKYTLIVDALFGIGLCRNTKGMVSELINKINSQDAFVAAVDIPSGIEGNSGRVLGAAVKADLTVTFAVSKIGHLLYPGKDYSGEVVVKQIGIPVSDTYGSTRIFTVEKSDIGLLPKRDEYGNKATFGKLLVVAGSKNICGAAFFASISALKSGIGMVRILTEKSNRTALSTLIPEALIDTYDDCGKLDSVIISALNWADAAVIGPGIGTDKNSERLLNSFLGLCDLPIVLDADALNIIAENEDFWEKVPSGCVVTPHVGEMSRLVRLSASEIKSDPIGTASSFAKKYNLVCILKDAVTVTAYPDGRCFINGSGCSALSTAGSGDVLAGIAGGFAARFRGCALPIEALAVYYHGMLGERAAAEIGESAVTAVDIIKAMNGFLTL